MQALKEALAAAKEVEDVLALVAKVKTERDEVARCSLVRPGPRGSLWEIVAKQPPKWTERAAIVLVEAKHSVALELEFVAIAGHPAWEAKDVVQLQTLSAWEMIPALHCEGVQLARHML